MTDRIAGQSKGLGKHLMVADVVHQDEPRAYGPTFGPGQPDLGGEQVDIRVVRAGQAGAMVGMVIAFP